MKLVLFRVLYDAMCFFLYYCIVYENGFHYSPTPPKTGFLCVTLTVLELALQRLALNSQINLSLLPKFWYWSGILYTIYCVSQADVIGSYLFWLQVPEVSVYDSQLCCVLHSDGEHSSRRLWQTVSHFIETRIIESEITGSSIGEPFKPSFLESPTQ